MADMNDLAGSDLFNEHIHIVALLHGWNFVDTKYPLSDRQIKFQGIDKAILSKDFATRLSIGMLYKFWKFRSLSEPEQDKTKRDVPSWMWRTPGEDGIEFQAALSGTPWPGIREEMCVHPEHYEGNTFFWSQMFTHWRFAWPYDLSESIEVNRVTNMFQLIPEFRRRMYDVNSWTFESDFFDHFPNFQGRAVKYEPQLAVVRLHDRTDLHERLIQRADRDEFLRRKLQIYYDSLADLRNAMAVHQ